MQITNASRELVTAQAEPRRDPDFGWGRSARMLRLRERAARLAESSSSALLLGETGTGKSALARWLHARSPRRGAAFVHVDCAALGSGVIESELFGHERGAFTGAATRRAGRFEQAAGGTLLLDEIAELAPVQQAKLLRVLQEREFERVGGSRTLPMTARIIAATNRDLAAAVADGRFRADLYYRLAVICLELPPLRERVEDIDELVALAVRDLPRAGEPGPPALTECARAALGRHRWPGNVRELRNLLERAAVCAEGAVDGDWVRDALGAGAAPRGPQPESPRPLDDARRVLAACGGNVARAARELGVPRSTLRYRLAARSGAPAPAPEQLTLPGLSTRP
jgi:DNA-binding NtrC family response regulator